MSDPADFVYAGRKSCGCVHSFTGDPKIADLMRERDGLTIERMPALQAIEEFMQKCTHVLPEDHGRDLLSQWEREQHV
jgi:hypothetical protein